MVLKSAKVPSILIELGYVTNEADAQLLKSERWREKVSTSIVTAIDNYFSHQLARLPMYGVYGVALVPVMAKAGHCGRPLDFLAGGGSHDLPAMPN